jgi:hypothetical protein
MKSTTSAAMKEYLSKNILVHPYNEIVKTRRTMVCKWVLLESVAGIDAVDSVTSQYCAAAFQETSCRT